MTEEGITLFSKKVYDLLRKRFKNCKIYLDSNDNVLYITIRFSNGYVYTYKVMDLFGEIFGGLQAYQLVNTITKELKHDIMKYYFR